MVYALNAKTGIEVWRYDPDVDASYNRKACCDEVNRGVQVWKGKVYVATLDGYKVCLNAADGKVLWRKDSFTDRTVAYTITGAPQIAKNVVVIGNSGAEFGVRGYITAYDLETGEQKWRFFVVPGDPKKPFEHPEIVAPMIYRSLPSYGFKKGTFGTGLNYTNVDPPYVSEARKYITNQPDTVYRNYLKAWDPVTRKEAWKVELDIPKANGGVLSTAGNLVLEGTSTGYLRVYQANTGKLLKEIFTGTVIMAAPMTYKVDGEQYIAVMASFGGDNLAFGYKGTITEKYQNKGRILAFKLNGDATPLPPPFVEIKTPKPPDIKTDPALVEKGAMVFDNYCINCHSVSPSFSHYSQYPDLGKINETIHAAFKDVLLKGALSKNGMSSFADVLSEKDVEAVHQFLISEQKKNCGRLKIPGKNDSPLSGILRLRYNMLFGMPSCLSIQIIE